MKQQFHNLIGKIKLISMQGKSFVDWMKLFV